MFQIPGVQELDSGSYEITVNGTSGYAWFTYDANNDIRAYFTLPSGTTFPFALAMNQALVFTRIPEAFKDPGEFGKWAQSQLGGAVDYHSTIETQVAWNGN